MEWNAVYNAIFSFIFPGLGQIIEGYKTKGIILLVIAFALAFIHILVFKESLIMKAILTLYSLLAAYDAYRLY